MMGSIRKNDIKYARTDPRVVNSEVKTVPNQGPYSAPARMFYKSYSCPWYDLLGYKTPLIVVIDYVVFRLREHRRIPRQMVVLRKMAKKKKKRRLPRKHFQEYQSTVSTCRRH